MRPHWMGNVWKKCESYHWFWLYALMYSAKVLYVFLSYYWRCLKYSVEQAESWSDLRIKNKNKTRLRRFFFPVLKLKTNLCVFWDAARGHIGSLTTSLPIWLIKVQKASLHTKADVFTVSVAELSSKRKRHHHKRKMHDINKHWFPYVYWFIEIILHNKREGRQTSSSVILYVNGRQQPEKIMCPCC